MMTLSLLFFVLYCVLAFMNYAGILCVLFVPVLGVNVTERGRLVEEYNFLQVASLYDSKIARKLANQVQLDVRHDVFTPTVTTTPITPLGELTLNKLLERTEFSISYSVKEFADIVLISRASCGQLVHPSLRDFWYATEASKLGIATIVGFVSPPALLPINRSPLTEFEISDDQHDACVAETGSVRYSLVSKPPGTRLDMMQWQSKDYRIPFFDAMMIAAGLIRKLELMHMNLHMIHGNLRAENVYVHLNNTGEETFSVTLSDLTKASRLPENATWSETVARDEVLEAVCLVAKILNTPEYMDYEQDLIVNEGESGLQSFRNTALLCVIDSLNFDPIEELRISHVSRALIKYELMKVLTVVRSATGDNVYSELHDLFDRCRRIARGSLP